MLAGALALGALSYGLSVYFDALALRALGAAREAAIFAVAPFAGALLAPFVLPETLDLRDVAAGVLMGIGVVLLLRERHEHLHVHEPLDHDHAHVHDEHHQHAHPSGADAGEPHSHEHHHDLLEHSHAARERRPPPPFAPSEVSFHLRKPGDLNTRTAEVQSRSFRRRDVERPIRDLARRDRRGRGSWSPPLSSHVARPNLAVSGPQANWRSVGLRVRRLTGALLEAGWCATTG